VGGFFFWGVGFLLGVGCGVGAAGGGVGQGVLSLVLGLVVGGGGLGGLWGLVLSFVCGFFLCGGGGGFFLVRDLFNGKVFPAFSLNIVLFFSILKRTLLDGPFLRLCPVGHAFPPLCHRCLFDLGFDTDLCVTLLRTTLQPVRPFFLVLVPSPLNAVTPYVVVVVPAS